MGDSVGTHSDADQNQAPTVSIETEYLGTAEIWMDPPSPVGTRRIVNVREGTFRGPRIKATIVAPTGDWLLPMSDGILRLDVRATLKTDDGEFILWEAGGVIARTQDVMDLREKRSPLTRPILSQRRALARIQIGTHGSTAFRLLPRWFPYKGGTSPTTCLSCGDDVRPLARLTPRNRYQHGGRQVLYGHARHVCRVRNQLAARAAA
jgi:hypothetical protein